MATGRKTGGRVRIDRPYFDPTVFAFCTHCHQVKKREQFPKNKNNPNGLHSWCKECNNAGSNTWVEANYRERRDKQALWARRHVGSARTGPVRRRTVARFQRIEQSS